MSNENTKRVTITIPEEEYARLAARAKEKGLTLNAVIRQDLNDIEFLQEQVRGGKKVMLGRGSEAHEKVLFRW